MTALLTAEEARRDLRLGPAGDPDEDAELASKIAQASAIFLTYHSDGAIPEDWYDESSPPVMTIPEEVKGAVAIILIELWDNRGENPLNRAYPLMRLLRGPKLA